MEIELITVAKKYGTPVYIYDMDKTIERIKTLTGLLNKNIKLYYAVKANPNLQVLKILKPYLAGLDVSSGGEIKQSLLAAYTPENFSFAGPGKTESEIDTAIENNTGSISVESIDDFKRIANRAKIKNKKANISVRLNPLKLINKFALKMGGKATQFGIDEENFQEIFDQIENNRFVKFTGYHVYSGTQCLDADSLNENNEYSLEMIGRIIDKFKLIPEKINLGGGFGIPYFHGNDKLDFEKVIKRLNSLTEKFTEKHGNIEFIIELGRFIIGEFGYYLTKILSIKDSRDKKILITDGGMHHNLAASGNLGQVIKKNYPVENLSSKGKKETVDITGCLCTPIDLLASNIEIDNPQAGDILQFGNSGAYGFTASPLLFLGHETPAEIVIINGKTEIARAPKDILNFN